MATVGRCNKCLFSHHFPPPSSLFLVPCAQAESFIVVALLRAIGVARPFSSSQFTFTKPSQSPSKQAANFIDLVFREAPRR